MRQVGIFVIMHLPNQMADKLHKLDVTLETYSSVHSIVNQIQVQRLFDLYIFNFLEGKTCNCWILLRRETPKISSQSNSIFIQLFPLLQALPLRSNLACPKLNCKRCVVCSYLPNQTKFLASLINFTLQGFLNYYVIEIDSN